MLLRPHPPSCRSLSFSGKGKATLGPFALGHDFKGVKMGYVFTLERNQVGEAGQCAPRPQAGGTGIDGPFSSSLSEPLLWHRYGCGALGSHELGS